MKTPDATRTAMRSWGEDVLSTMELLDQILDALADRVAERLAGPKTPERIPLDRVKEHGAPSARWLRDCAKQKKITVYGPRGARYVLKADLDALLESITLRPRVSRGDTEDDGMTIDLAVLAAKRA